MKYVRHTAVAGLFYPADPRELAALVDELLDGAPAVEETSMPVALVAPHAGYVYSGPTAAAVYRRLRSWASAIDRVVVVGPAHRVPVHHLALSSDDAFATPLGEIPLDFEMNRALLEHGAMIDDRAHEHEHSIEVQLPFLQRVLGTGWSLVPIVAGSGSATAIADALAGLWGVEGTLVVISSDLSHHHDLHTARRLDRDTAATIVSAAWEQLGSDDACGAIPLRGALELIRRRGEQVAMVDMRTSADAAGSADRVVGYGSFVVR